MPMTLPDKAALLARAKPYRDNWDKTFRPPGLEPAGEGEESVWDYPRPPIIAPVPGPVRVMLGDVMIAESDCALEVKETAGAPVPYIRPEDVRVDWLEETRRLTVCEWKGATLYYDLVVPDGNKIEEAAWNYPDPFDDLPEGYTEIAGWYGFYADKLDCFIGDERARPQPGGFYGGWVTDRVKGPIKGGPGTGGW